MPTLGCLESLDVKVLYQCGSAYCSLKNLVSVNWNRILDDTSTAIVEVGITGSANDPCCECLTRVVPLCMELAIYRNGILEWIGPITKVRYQRSLVTIEAEDMTHWLKLRVAQGFDNTDPAVAATVGPVAANGGNEISDIAKNILEVAFSEHDPCLLEYAVQTDVNSRPTLFNDMKFSFEQFPPYEDTVFGQWIDLSTLGLDFTTVGRSILYGAETFNLRPLGTLMDNHILGDIEVTVDSDLMANRWIVRWGDSATETDDTNLAQCAANCARIENNGQPCPLCNDNGFVSPCTSVPCPAIVDGQRYCFGLVERLNSEGIPFNVDTALLAGQAYLRASETPPYILEFPEGSLLAPNAPFDLHSLIPGVRIDVAISQLCLVVAQSFKLIEVTYNLTAEGNEEIGLTLAPMNIIPGGS